MTPDRTTGWRRALYLVAGWLFVALAVLGLALPLLPTTPFVLLAGSCFLRSSERARRWLADSRWFGPPLRDWHEHRAVRRPVKILAVVTVSAVIALSFARDLPGVVQVSIVLLGAVGLFVIWRLPVVPADVPVSPKPSPETNDGIAEAAR